MFIVLFIYICTFDFNFFFCCSKFLDPRSYGMPILKNAYKNKLDNS